MKIDDKKKKHIQLKYKQKTRQKRAIHTLKKEILITSIIIVILIVLNFYIKGF